MSTAPQSEEASFEEILDRLQQVVTRLEDGNLPLEKGRIVLLHDPL